MINKMICLKAMITSLMILLSVTYGNMVVHAEYNQLESNALKAMDVVAENEYLQLYINEEDSSIAVLHKESKDIWFSNPIDGELDTIATPFNKSLLRSQFSLRYYNENVQLSEMDNYNDSIKEKQFVIEEIEDGVLITYTLGEAVAKIILPTVISEERYLQYYNQMDDKAQKQVKRNYSFLELGTMKEADKKEYLELYPGLENNNIYILKSGTKDYKQEEIMEYFAAVGYSLEDMEQDKIDNGYSESANKPYFIVPMKYSLDKDNLIVSIEPKAIEYNKEDYYLIDVDVLEYFGAANTDKEGYMFVPDGSGALIYLNNGKITKSSYSGAVYGQDKTTNMMINKKSELSENLSVKMPVYGIAYDDKALFAVIEDGDAFADINADIAGRINNYNNIYSGFTYLQNGAISLGDIVGSNSFQMYAKEVYDGEYKIRYSFLSDDKANYSGMAKHYQEYLVDRGLLMKNIVLDQLPFYVEYIGAINKTKSFLGIKYQATEVLTSYKEAIDISQKLIDSGLNNIKVRYSGWMNGGLGSTAATDLVPVRKLKEDGIDLKKFNLWMGEKAIQVYHEVDFQTVKKDKLMDGYSESKLAPRYFDKTVVRTGDYIIPNGIIASKNIKLISSFFLNSVVDSFTQKAESYDLNGLSVAKLSTDLYSDFMEDRETNRQQASNYNKEALRNISSQYPLMSVNGNAYSFEMTTDMIEVPMDSNGFYLFDESIPFYQMVIRGFIEFSGDALNLSDDYRKEFLKSIETGAGLYFKWIHADNSLVKETEYDYLYSVNYEYWFDKAIESYQEANEVLSKLQGKTIIQHSKIEDGVYKTIYDNGTEIVVNYNDYAVTVDGVHILEKNFSMIKEG